MASEENNSLLNDILISLVRSLLQYAGESWPWMQPDAAAERALIDRLVRDQQRDIARLANLLADRDWAVEFGSYPTEYTDLHYVALDYLLAQIIENERALIADIRPALEQLTDDPPARSLLEQILSREQETLKQLEQLAGAHSSSSA